MPVSGSIPMHCQIFTNVFDEILTLHDAEASRDNILEYLEQLEDKLTAKDNLFLFYSGHGGTYTFTDVIKAGASDFILKPFAEDEVEAKINRVIRERQLRAEMLSTSESLREVKDFFLDCVSVFAFPLHG